MTGLDHHLRHWVITHRAGALTPLFEAATWAGSWGLAWLVLGLAVALWRSRWSPLLGAVLAVALAEAAAAVLKVLIDRPRPHSGLADPPAEVRIPHTSSFPSGHSTTAFAGATVLALAWPRAAVPLYLLAAAVAYSRVYLGVHYPADAVAGALLGLALGALAWAAARRLAPVLARRAGRLAP